MSETGFVCLLLSAKDNLFEKIGWKDSTQAAFASLHFHKIGWKDMTQAAFAYLHLQKIILLKRLFDLQNIVGRKIFNKMWNRLQCCDILTKFPNYQRTLILANFGYSKALRYAVFGSRKKPCSSKPHFVRFIPMYWRDFFFKKQCNFKASVYLEVTVM